MVPSNEGRGYVLRRILRRASRHAYKLGKRDPFLHKFVSDVVSDFQQPDQFVENLNLISETILMEEEKFSETLVKGLRILQEELEKSKTKVLDGNIAFLLYDTYGFPVELTADICRENEVTFNLEKFDEDRSKLPDDFIRSTLGKIFDQVYDTGERDKFRMRLERIEKEYSEISITHKGLIEIASNDRADPTVVWTNKTPDHQLEEIYLRRLMKYLGASEEESNAPTQTVRKDFVFLKTEKQIQFIQIDEDFPTAWRILSTAIDRVGFEVEDRARSDGKIYLKYTDGDNKIEKSFFSRIFSSDDNEQIARTYVVTIESSGKSSIVKVKPENESGSDATSQNIISIIFEQLV